MSQKNDDASMINEWARGDTVSKMEWLPESSRSYLPLSSEHGGLSKSMPQNETLFGDSSPTVAEEATTTLSGTGMAQTRGPGLLGQFQKHFTKPLVPFLTMVYLHAESILQAARSVHVFHMQSLYIARQALHLVILLNDLVDPKEDPDDTQQAGRIDLEDDLIELLEAMEEWGTRGERGGSVDHKQRLLKIQYQYAQIFKERFYFHDVRDHANDIIYQKLLAYDNGTIEKRQRRQIGGNIIRVDYWIGHEGRCLENQEEPEPTPEIRTASSPTLDSTCDVCPFLGNASSAHTEAAGGSSLERSSMISTDGNNFTEKSIPGTRDHDISTPHGHTSHHPDPSSLGSYSPSRPSWNNALLTSDGGLEMNEPGIRQGVDQIDTLPQLDIPSFQQHFKYNGMYDYLIGPDNAPSQGSPLSRLECSAQTSPVAVPLTTGNFDGTSGYHHGPTSQSHSKLDHHSPTLFSTPLPYPRAGQEMRGLGVRSQGYITSHEFGSQDQIFLNSSSGYAGGLFASPDLMDTVTQGNSPSVPVLADGHNNQPHRYGTLQNVAGSFARQTPIRAYTESMPGYDHGSTFQPYANFDHQSGVETSSYTNSKGMIFDEIGYSQALPSSPFFSYTPAPSTVSFASGDSEYEPSRGFPDPMDTSDEGDSAASPALTDETHPWTAIKPVERLQRALGPSSPLKNEALIRLLLLIVESTFILTHKFEPTIGSDEGQALIKQIQGLPGCPPNDISTDSIFTLFVDFPEFRCLICGKKKQSRVRGVGCVRKHLEHRPYACSGGGGCKSCHGKQTVERFCTASSLDDHRKKQARSVKCTSCGLELKGNLWRHQKMCRGGIRDRYGEGQKGT